MALCWGREYTNEWDTVTVFEDLTIELDRPWRSLSVTFSFYR